ncbi:MAG: hypothetical protein Q7K43_00570, partial [Candidatus Woesearchaeota archaeon]|nr:hypothetical protein [Candidatus Woesearchaeota archaeon]
MHSKKTLFLLAFLLVAFLPSVFAVRWDTASDLYGVYALSNTADVNVSFQARTCVQSNCSDASFIGPNGTSSTWFTTDFNRSTISWDLNVLPNNRYFQYTVHFISNDGNYSPRLYDTNVSYFSTPSNVKFNIGNNDLNSWNWAGGLTSFTINDSNTTPGFSAALNTALTAGGGCGCTGCIYQDSNNYCSIPFNLSSATRGKVTASNINIQYSSVTLQGKITTFKNNKPRSFLGLGEKVTIRFDANRISTTPLITIIDSTGSVKVNSTLMTNVGTGIPGDLNSFDYNYSLNGGNGWYDVTIGRYTFEKAFYQSPVWTDKYTSWDANVFPFSMDVNVREPNVSQRWFAPVDQAIDFNYNAASSSIRVLDYNGSNYLEIPSQAYSATSSGSYITKANVVFLASFDRNETRNFFINYTTIDKNLVYASDLNSTFTNFALDINNNFYKTRVDVNQGGVLTKISSKAGSNTDLNGYNPMQLSPELVINPTTYRASSLTSPSFTRESGALVSRIIVSGVFSPVIDYNISYKFYAKNSFFLMDTNVLALSSSYWNSLSDSYFFGGLNKFTKLAVNNNGIVSIFDVNAGNTAWNWNDINYFALYNKTGFDSVGQVFLQKTSSKTLTATTTASDTSTNAYWKRNIYSGSVSSNDYFNTKTAVSTFNPYNETSDLNKILVQLQNPVTISIGTTSTNDSTPPTNLSVNHNPTDANDLTDQNCYSTWSDNLLMSYVDINITGPNLSIQATRTAGNTASMEADYNIPASLLHAGTVTCSFTAYDIARNNTTVSTSFTVKDFTAPTVLQSKNTPDTNALIDPGTSITLDANINEYSRIQQVVLLTRYSTDAITWSDWNSTTMNNDVNYGDYNYHFTASFSTTSGTNSIWQYKIYTKDSNNYDANTAATTLYSYWDLTWTSTPASFGNKSGDYGTSTTIGDLNITNTGDQTLDFTITSNWDDKTKISYNGTNETTSGYAFTLSSSSTQTLAVKATAKTTERSDSLTMTITPTQALSSPDSNTSTATIISTAGGPFMLIEWVDTNTSVTQEQTGIIYTAKLTNAGNTDANSLTMDWILPSGFSITSGSSSSTLAALAVNASTTNSITASVSSTATTGLKTVTFTAGCCSDSNKTQASTTNVTINPKSTTTTTTTTVTVTQLIGGGGGGGAGGGGSLNLNSDDNSIFQTAKQKDAFFQTTDIIELVHGKTDRFTLKVTNPLSDANLTNLTIQLTGLLSKYISISPQKIPLLKPKQAITITLYITAPNYFTKGNQDLNFIVSGKLEKDNNKQANFQENRTLTLEIHDYSKEETTQALQKAQTTINQLKKEGYYTNNLIQQYNDAQAALEKRDYETSMQLSSQITQAKQKITDTNKTIAFLEAQVETAKNQGIPTYQTIRLINLAKLALQRGDIENAQSSIKDAQMTYALETKGEINWLTTIQQNWLQILAGLAILTMLGFFFKALLRLNWLKSKVKNLTNQE